MLVLLANLPVGDLPIRFINDYQILEYVNVLWPYIEWVSVLGDPASAFCAAFSTLAKDFVCSYFLFRAEYKNLQPLDKSLIGLGMVASRTRPEEYTLSSFLPMAFSRLISEVLMNPDVTATPQLRDHLFSLKNLFDNKHLKLVLTATASRNMLTAFEESDTEGKTLRAQLLALQSELKTSPQTTEILNSPKSEKQMNFPNIPEATSQAPELLPAVSAVILNWPETPLGKITPERSEIEKVTPTRVADPTLKEEPIRIFPSTSIKFVIQAIRRSRDNFLTSVAFPMVLVFASIVNTFFGAYKQLGDGDTAQGIAYGTWYMWILILSVFSNTSASSAKTKFVRDALRTSAGIREKQIFVESVMARNIYGNNANWFRWLEKAGVPKLFRMGILGPGDERKLGGITHFLCYVVWQVVGWLWVGFACANAAAVAFTTPTIGVGCRTFNHVLYAGGTLLAALLRVFKREAFERQGAYTEKGRQNEKNISRRAQELFAVFYHVVCTVNVLILSLGTLFQISGLYNNCKCQALFGDDDTIIDVGTNTGLAVKNATRYWLSMAYVAYTTAWVACGLAICTRAFVTWILDNNFGDEDLEEEEEFEEPR
ncbi:hypothetical protein AA313_de0206750 [Arthrobotrys entomopaga]|nr:hypothetical protein AA313_de0206750 [Arthrobotrys entomopaga]